MPDQTTPERIIALFEHLWPISSTRFHVRNDMSHNRVTLQITSLDYMSVYAKVHFNAQDLLDTSSGYDIEVSYPSFNGSLTSLTVNLEVLTAVHDVVKDMQKTDLIKGA